MPRVTRTHLSHVLLVVPAIWAAWNGVRYVFDTAVRHRAESAWFILAGMALAFTVRNAWNDRAAGAGPPVPIANRHSAILVVPFLILAFAVYAPILSIGLLSDDFVLLRRALDGAFIDPTWEYVRPLPLLAWWAVDLLLPSADVPAALHAINAACHGLNAWLVFRLAERLGLERISAVAAGVVFLCWPFSVEPVAWASGIFDILATTFMLVSALTVLTERRPTNAVVCIAALTIAALACKETAVALPLLLIGLYPFVEPPMRRQTISLVGICVIMVAAYVSWRLATGIPTVAAAQPSGYVLKEFISRPFGTLGLGFHHTVFSQTPLLAAALALLWPFLTIRPLLSARTSPVAPRVVLLGAVWVMASVLPLLSMLYIGADLQGSRYLYLGSSLWAVAVVTMANPQMVSVPDKPALTVLASIAAISLTATLMHQRPWREAGTVTQRIVTALQSVSDACGSVTAAGLPDNIDGAYVFRNGLSQAFSMAARGRATVEHCNVTWDGARFQIVAP